MVGTPAPRELVFCESIQNTTLNDPIFNTRDDNRTDLAGLAFLADGNAPGRRKLESAVIYACSD